MSFRRDRTKSLTKRRLNYPSTLTFQTLGTCSHHQAPLAQTQVCTQMLPNYTYQSHYCNYYSRLVASPCALCRPGGGRKIPFLSAHFKAAVPPSQRSTTTNTIGTLTTVFDRIDARLKAATTLEQLHQEPSNDTLQHVDLIHPTEIMHKFLFIT